MKNKLGYLYAISSAIIYGIMPIFTKSLINFGINPITSSFYRMFLWLLPIFIYCKFIIKIDLSLKKKDLIEVFLAGALFGGTSITLFSSYKYLGAGCAESIHFIYPCIIFIIMSFVFKNKPSKAEVLALILSCIGVLMLADFSDVHELSGVIYAVLSAFFFAFYSVSIEKSNMPNMNVMKSLFYVNFFGAIVIGLYALVLKIPIKYDFSHGQWGFLLVYSFFLTIGATLLYQLAIFKIGATKTGILSTAEPIVSLIAGFIIFSEDMGINKIIAIIFIVLAAIYIVRRQDKVNE